MATSRLLPLVQQAGAGLLDRIVPALEAAPMTRSAPAFAQPEQPQAPMVFPEMRAGGGRFVSNEDGKMYNGQNFAKPAPVEEPWYKRLMNDPAAIAQLGIGFNSMRLNPDAGLAQVLNDRVKSIGAERKQNRTTEQVSLQLKNMGMFEEAGLIEANPELAVPIFTAMLKTKNGVEATAEMRTFAERTEGMSEKEKLMAHRIALGLLPRAGQPTSVYFDRSYSSGAGTAAAAAEGAANSTAMVNGPLRDQFEFGFSALEQALGGTGQTGKILGNIPGLTTGAQIADNAKALLLPIMKSVFRGAGEGVFTDKDQETLEAMLPTRSMTTEAASQALDSVKMLVSLKLQNPQFDISIYGRGMGGGLNRANPVVKSANPASQPAPAATSVRKAADAILNGG
jgi:hypothetical protein